MAAERLCSFMKSNRKLAAILLVGLIQAQLTFASEVSVKGWVRRGIAVFSNISFDFDKKLVITPMGAQGLEDCSSVREYCLVADTFQISIPKACSVLTSHQSSLVVSSYKEADDRHLSIDKIQAYLLVNPKYPFIIYEYMIDRGITGISYDAHGLSGRTPQVDILKAVKSNTYITNRLTKWSYSRILTLDKMGACNEKD